MGDKSKIFDATESKSILTGRKTMFREPIDRVCKAKNFNPAFAGPITEFDRSDTRGYDWHFRDQAMRWHDMRSERLLAVLPYQIGDRLWTREPWRCHGWATDVATFMYQASERASYTEMTEQFPVADHAYIKPANPGTWRSAIRMPRWVFRTTLVVTGVKIERYRDISEEDAALEGFAPGPIGDPIPETPIGNGWTVSSPGGYASAKGHFMEHWETSRNIDDWDYDPFVAAYTFAVYRTNIDKMETPHA